MANYGKYYIAVRVLLIKKYLETHAGPNRVVKRRELEQLLKDHNMAVEKKTLYADFAVLEDVFGMQLEYDPHKKGYRLLNPPFETHELRLLVDCVQAATFITEEEAAAITAKIRGLTIEENRALLNRPAVVMDRIQRIEDSVVRKADLIHQAIAENRKISFRYFRYIPDRGKHTEFLQADDICDLFIVSPRRLVWQRGTYYLERYRNDEYYHLQFEVGRMIDIEVLPDPRNCKETPLTEQQQSDIDKVLAWLKGPEETITIRFRNEVIQDVLEAWGPDTVIIPVDKHHFQIVIKKRCNTDYFQWFSQWGGYAKFLSPPRVVQEFNHYLDELKALYNEDIEPIYVLSPEEIE